jgi:hypothetical protein
MSGVVSVCVLVPDGGLGLGESRPTATTHRTRSTPFKRKHAVTVSAVVDLVHRSPFVFLIGPQHHLHLRDL